MVLWAMLLFSFDVAFSLPLDVNEVMRTRTPSKSRYGGGTALTLRESIRCKQQTIFPLKPQDDTSDLLISMVYVQEGSTESRAEVPPDRNGIHLQRQKFGHTAMRPISYLFAEMRAARVVGATDYCPIASK